MGGPALPGALIVNWSVMQSPMEAPVQKKSEVFYEVILKTEVEQSDMDDGSQKFLVCQKKNFDKQN